jgi:hypothetical protein
MLVALCAVAATRDPATRAPASARLEREGERWSDKGLALVGEQIGAREALAV